MKLKNKRLGRSTVVILSIIITIIGALMWTGLGWGVAWVLDKGLNADVNYSIFVYVSLGIFFIKWCFAMLGVYLKSK
jgi:hypothetical protein